MERDLVNGVYKVFEELGQDDSRRLMLARNLVSSELVLLAVPAPGASEQARSYMRLEGEIFAEIVNPHVQRVLDASADEREPTIVWEYIAGWSLNSLLRAGARAPIESALALMRQVARGLSAVHSRGAVYRALSPQRILLTRDNVVKLATTPEAILSHKSGAEGAPMPVTSPIRYLAPEQIDGQFEARSDLYSLAAITYELVTGKTIYGDMEPVTLAVRIQNTDPQPLSHYRPDVGEEVDSLFKLCLARNADHRLDSAAQLVRALDVLLAGHQEAEMGPLLASLAQQPIEVVRLNPASSTGRAAGLSADQAGEATRDGLRNPEAGDYATPSRPPIEAGYQPALSDRLHTQARLVSNVGVAYFLRPPNMIVGRQGGNGHAPDIDLQDLDSLRVVSRQHARLQYEGGRWYVSDMNARNGTWVNDRPVVGAARVELAHGARLRLGNVVLTYDATATANGA